MNGAYRMHRLRATSTGVVNTVLAIILILSVLGIAISRLGATVGLFAGLLGGALAGAVCATLILLTNIRDVLDESRAIGTDFTPHGKTLVAATEGSEKQQAHESARTFAKEKPLCF